MTADKQYLIEDTKFGRQVGPVYPTLAEARAARKRFYGSNTKRFRINEAGSTTGARGGAS